MKKKKRKSLYVALLAIGAFLLWTVLLGLVDVKPIGPEGTTVGFATLNRCIHQLIGVHLPLYYATDWLSLIPIAVVGCFGVLGLCQWIKRKRLGKVDYSILVLGGFYVVVMATYLLFEKLVINYRPILIEGVLEASYPSSTTMLVICVMATAMMQLWERIGHKWLRRCVIILIAVFIAFMVIGRLLSGVHWFTDIVGGGLISTGLVALYRFVSRMK